MQINLTWRLYESIFTPYSMILLLEARKPVLLTSDREPPFSTIGDNREDDRNKVVGC